MPRLWAPGRRSNDADDRDAALGRYRHNFRRIRHLATAMAAFDHGEQAAEWGRVQDFEENWLADSDEDGDERSRGARRHSHDEADTDQQSLSQLADQDHDRVHESEGRAAARAMLQSGYRDGAAKGSEAAFQQRFDAGFARGMAVGRLVGELWQQVQLTLKQLPQGGDAIGAAAAATAPLTRTADGTFAAERQLLQRDADACLQLLLHELPEVLAAVSSPAAMAAASNGDGDGDAVVGAEVAAALAAAVPSDELDADARAVAAFDLRRVQDERREICAVLARLRATLRRFPTPTLLVADALVALFAE
jgi:flagellar biosynthesis/type III secretory pathway protein FliH